MKNFLLASAALVFASPLAADDHTSEDGETSAKHFGGADLFGLSVAADPQISPDGDAIAYVRRTNDIMVDQAVSSIWLIDIASGDETPLVTGEGSHVSPRWSPEGDRLAYVSTESGGGPELHVRWMDSGVSANITALPEAPSAISWSPDGESLAYTSRVPDASLALGKPPAKPEGAEWGKPLQVIDKVTYRNDGGGYVKAGTMQLFLVDATGGAPRQLTNGEYSNGGTVEWTPDGKTILYSANRNADWELEPLQADIYALDVESGAISQLTERVGPDFAPQVSPDGRRIAYLGFDDVGNAFDHTELYVMNIDGSNETLLLGDMPGSVDGLEWTDAGLFASYENDGEHRVARVAMNGRTTELAPEIGSTYYALPYVGGQWSVSEDGTIAFTDASSIRPPDIAVTTRSGTRRLTALNDTKLGAMDLGETRALSVTAPDGVKIPSWITLPPDYVEGTRVPMILEMHGGPYASYGAEFSVDYQLYAAAGYAVLFTNPGGSTGYGEEFADRIEDNYPISNFDELMAAVDAAVAAGYADPDNLYVTGGSGGGILTAWVVGKTDRFKAAATHKPVINWVSQSLMADGTAFFGRYWMGGLPWERPEHYWERGPLSLMGNVTTPTLVLVGADDYRTPRSEAEQYYGALKLAGVETALVITPDSSHNNLTQTPSQQAARTDSVIAWFDKYRKGEESEDASGEAAE
ncbi:MAG: S9 family peptidase [Pseudomonadota bacterium]